MEFCAGTGALQSRIIALIPPERVYAGKLAVVLTIWTVRERLVERLLQLDIGPTDFIDYALCPIKVLLFSLQRPPRWRILNNISQITDLIG